LTALLLVRNKFCAIESETSGKTRQIVPSGHDDARGARQEKTGEEFCNQGVMDEEY
jgi:hypothetical protein